MSPNLRYRWVILGVCWLAYVVAFLQRLSIGPLAPFIKADLGLTNAQVGLLMSAAAFGYMLTLVPAGWLVDRIGVRWLLLIGEIIGGIFVGSMFTVTTFTQGLVLMALAGAGMGCLMPSTTKAILVWFPVKERATAMGFKQTAVNVGGIITATTLPTVALVFGWHYGFLGIGAIAIVIGIISFVLYREAPQSIGPGTTPDPVVHSLPRPSVREIFRERDIWLVMLAGFGMCFVEFSAMAHFVLYTNEALLVPVVTAGFLLALLEGGGGFGRPITGFISDRIWHGNRKKPYAIMCWVSGAVIVVFAYLGPNSPLWVVAFLSLILGFAAVGWAGLHLTLIVEIAGKELAGVVTGIAVAVTILGNVIGPPVFGHLVDITGSYQMSWLLLVSLAVMAAIAINFVREERRRI